MVSGLPRVLIAAPASGQGKTTVTVGLLAALRASGLDVAPFKVGPDYIDPGFHTLAAGRVGRNLDPHLCGEERMVPLLRHGHVTPQPADLAVIEGVMGLFDGRTGTGGFGSSAHVARLTSTPVVAVVTMRGAARTIAAAVLGLARFDPSITLAGVILNHAYGGPALAEVRAEIERLGVAVLGAIPRDPALTVPSRHLGLVPAAELDAAASAVVTAGNVIAAHVDLDALVALARSAPDLPEETWDPAAEVTPVAGQPVVAVATGRAFTFRYPEHDELLRSAGCRVVPLDPLTDTALPPDTSALYLGGGFPEVFADRLAANRPLLADIADAVRDGLPTLAECAGLLYLCESLDGAPMAGVVPAAARMTPRLTLGYHEAVAQVDSVVTRVGEVVRAHEFHRTTVPAASAAAWSIDGRREGFALSPAGPPSVLASYQHVHWTGHPEFASRLAAAASAFAGTPDRWGHRWSPSAVTPAPVLVEASAPSRHHGDDDAVAGLVDLAVNARPGPPAWLAEALTAGASTWGRYPDLSAARAAIARVHGVGDGQVLPTAGAMAAFGLVARAFRPRSIVVHPQFGGADEALAAAGCEVRHLILPEPFTLDHAALARLAASDAEAIFVGNPTNPTGVLHAASGLLGLRRPGRILVVDEAFADAIPGEPESLLRGDLTGVLVLRSLTKTWGLAGLRAGYVVGDPALIARLAAAQETWAVSTPALDAAVACLDQRGLAEASERAERLAADRTVLLNALADLGVPAVPGVAPFVLARVGDGVRRRLARLGYAVRGGDTFPGLGAEWVRIAVRDPETIRDFGRALAAALEGEPC